MVTKGPKCDIFSPPFTTCRNCTNSDRRHKVWLAAAEEQLSKALGNHNVPQKAIEHITKDRYGSFLRADKLRRVNQNAMRLAQLGFRQQDSRPTLFVCMS